MADRPGLPQDTDIIHCWLCFQWHELGDSSCPFSWLRRFGHTLARVHVWLTRIFDYVFDWYIKIALAAFLGAFLWLMLSMILGL